MADQDFNIKVVTTADTTGLQQTSEGLKSLQAEADRISKLPGKGFPQAGGIGAVPEGLLSDLEQVATTAETKVAPAFNTAGVSLARARQEAIVLARELATGGNVTRTLGSLLGALGPSIAIAAVAGYGLNKVIAGIGEEQLRVNREIGEQLKLLGDVEAKWDQAARGATSMEDVLKLAETSTETINSSQAKFLQFQNAGLAGWKEWIDALLTIKGFTSGPFEKGFEDQAKRLGQIVADQKNAQRAAVEDARAYVDAFDAEKLKPFEDAFADVNTKLQEAQRIQESTFDTDIYIKEGKKVQIYKEQLKELLDLERQRKKEAQETADEHDKDADFVQDQVKKASPQARRILQNEQAAQLARDQGKERDADLYQRSVDQLKRSSTPQTQAETQVLEKLIEQNGLLRELRDLWR